MAKQKEEDQQQADEDRKAKLRQAYSTATQQLREANRDQFNKLYQKAAEELGVEWSPRPTPEQRAEAELQALIEEYPHLRERLVGSSEEDSEGEESEGESEDDEDTDGEGDEEEEEDDSDDEESEDEVKKAGAHPK